MKAVEKPHTPAQLVTWVVMILLLYFFSIGPMAFLYERFFFDSTLFTTVFRVFYAPLLWLYDHPPFDSVIDAYVSLWGVG